MPKQDRYAVLSSFFTETFRNLAWLDGYFIRGSYLPRDLSLLKDGCLVADF